jgi:hypothetical protein
LYRDEIEGVWRRKEWWIVLGARSGRGSKSKQQPKRLVQARLSRSRMELALPKREGGVEMRSSRGRAGGRKGSFESIEVLEAP